jgi:hypothetical protein
MSIWLHQLSVKAHQSEMLREAAHRALIRQALAASTHEQEAGEQETFYAPTLARIGGWMILVGCYLQTHYGNICACEESPVMQSVSAR